jgi:transposase
MEPLNNTDQLRRSIEYFSKREKALREKADSERSKLRDCVVSAVTVHGISELEASRLAGVTRQTVRTWVGK